MVARIRADKLRRRGCGHSRCNFTESGPYGIGDTATLPISPPSSTLLPISAPRESGSTRCTRYSTTGQPMPVPTHRTADSFSTPSTSMWRRFRNFPASRRPGCKKRSTGCVGKTALITRASQTRRRGRSSSHMKRFSGRARKKGSTPLLAFAMGEDRRLPALHVLNGCGGNSATPGGNGRPRGEEQKTKASLGSVRPRQKRSASLSSSNGWPTINSTAVVRKPRNGSCRSGSISISPSAFARTASMPGAIRMRCCREWPWARRRMRSTLRDRTGGWLASILRVSKSGSSKRFAAC